MTSGLLVCGITKLFSSTAPPMALDDPMSRTLRELTEQAAKEQDPERLRQLVLGINTLLDIIERRVAEIQGPSRPEGN
jgi:hypothetical protein